MEELEILQLLGAGPEADDRVAVSCTGVGEAFIRTCAAHEVATQIRLGQDLEGACSNMLEMVARLVGEEESLLLMLKVKLVFPFKLCSCIEEFGKTGRRK